MTGKTFERMRGDARGGEERRRGRRREKRDAGKIGKGCEEERESKTWEGQARKEWEEGSCDKGREEERRERM